jgi:hypothetical protein
MAGWVELAASALAYAIGIVAQTTAVRRGGGASGHYDVGLLVRLATDRLYALGFAAQVTGFVAAFLARADLPLYLVQTAGAAAVGLAALAGAIILEWRVRRAEIAALAVMAVGLVGVVLAAEPSTAAPVTVTGGIMLLVALACSAGLSFPAGRLKGTRRAVVLGALSGLDFAVLAVATRPLAAGPLLDLLTHPLAWLAVAAAVVGQSHLASALQHGSATAATAAMEAASAVLAAAAGLVMLGDRVAVGREPLLLAGLALVVAAVVTMALLRPPTAPGADLRDAAEDPKVESR